MKKFLANGLGTFSNKGNPVFSNGSKGLTRNPLSIWVFVNVILAHEPFAQVLLSFENCL